MFNSLEVDPDGGEVKAKHKAAPLSLLLSNLVLDELDRELERRGHRFARYLRMIATSTCAAAERDGS